MGDARRCARELAGEDIGVAGLARASGLTRHTVRAALTGKKAPRAETIEKLAAAVGRPFEVVEMMLQLARGAS